MESQNGACQDTRCHWNGLPPKIQRLDMASSSRLKIKFLKEVVLNNHSRHVFAIHPDGSKIVYANSNGVHLHDLENGSTQMIDQEAFDQNQTPEDIAFNTEGTKIALCTNKRVCQYDVQTLANEWGYNTNKKEFFQIKYGKSTLTVASDHGISRFNNNGHKKAYVGSDFAHRLAAKADISFLGKRDKYKQKNINEIAVHPQQDIVCFAAKSFKSNKSKVQAVSLGEKIYDHSIDGEVTSLVCMDEKDELTLFVGNGNCIQRCPLSKNTNFFSMNIPHTEFVVSNQDPNKIITLDNRKKTLRAWRSGLCEYTATLSNKNLTTIDSLYMSNNCNRFACIGQEKGSCPKLFIFDLKDVSFSDTLNKDA